MTAAPRVDLSAPGLSAFAPRWQAAFAQECARHGIEGTLTATAEGLRPEFEGQEGADGPRVLQAFHEELEAAGVRIGACLGDSPGLDEAAADLVEAAVRHTIRRLRTLLIEHNSYLSGGLRYPFAGALTGVRERGLAVYRFPRLAPVDVEAVEDHVSIRFASGDLGEITSSGFYTPTLFEGDFELEARYELGVWRPHATQAACFALFAQVQDSSRRFYAQRMSTGGGAHFVLASLADALSPQQAVEGLAGRFRIRREGPRITCFHAGPGQQFVALGTAPAPEEPMVFGAKIWSMVACGGLAATVHDLSIHGTPAAGQIPPVPVVPDPRSNAGARP